MGNVTFGTKQELKSLEFGKLFYNILPKGVYKRPTISVSSGEVTVEGGTFLFYNTGADKYVAKVDDVALTLSVSEGKYLFIQYTYNASQVAQPTLVLSNTIETGPTQVRLCRFVNTGADSASLTKDESCMELSGAAEGVVDTGLIDYISYKQDQYSSQAFAMAFNQNVTSNSGTASVATVSSLAGIDPAKAQYLYINSTGALAVADANVPRFGKLVVAEKLANAPFTLNRFPHRAEVKGWDLEIDRPDVETQDDPMSMTAETDIYDAATVLTKETCNTTANVIALSALLKKSIDHIGALEREIISLKNKVDYLEKVKSYLGTQIDIPDNEHMPDPITTSKLVFTDIEIKSTGNVNIKGSITVDPNTSSFGTATSPIHNLYVTESLYTDQLFVTE